MAVYVHELLHVGIVNQKAELVKLKLNFVEHSLNFLVPLKICSMVMEMDKIVDVVGVLVVGREEPGVLEEAFCLIDLGDNDEDGGEQERELLGAHGLNFEGVVDRRNIQQSAGLLWENPGFLGDLDIFDASQEMANMAGYIPNDGYGS